MDLTIKIPQIASTPSPFYECMGFISRIIQQIPFSFTPFFLKPLPPLCYFINKVSCRSHLSTLLHNRVLPLDKTTFPARLKLFFATGKIEPP